jgi:hypothetical protein
VKYTDHTLPQINLTKYLPDVVKSDVNTTLSNMVFDRYFTKDDTTFVSGYVGTPNKNAITNRQIQEDTPHHQAFQLTPTMHTKVGTIDTAMSFTKFNQELSLIGVDINKYPQWGNSTSFNWVPPINLDMFVNYADYFWTSTTSEQQPQYFTIENKCTKSEFRVNSYKNIIQNRGDKFNMVGFDIYTNSFVISGDHKLAFLSGSTFYTNSSNTITLNNQTWTVTNTTYDHETDQTTIVVSTNIVFKSTIPPTNPVNEQWWLNSDTLILYSWDGNDWVNVTNITSITAQVATQALFSVVGVNFDTNSFLISNDVHDIFLNGFVFFTKHSNILLSNFWTTISSLYDTTSNITTVVIQEPIATYSTTIPTNAMVGQLWYNQSTKILSTWTGTIWQHIANRITADISLTEMLSAYEFASITTCNKSGWDVGLWDDNSVGSVLWNTALMEQITQSTEADWLAIPGNTLEQLAMWYNPITDYLYQYGDINHTDVTDVNYQPSWNAIIGNFSNILQETTGNNVWDGSKTNTMVQSDAWSSTNKWIHKSGLASFAGVKRAQVPVLEYNSSTELNRWTEATIPWSYRSSADVLFTSSTIAPSRLELEPIKNYVVDVINGHLYVYLFHKDYDVLANINLTDTFVNGYKFAIVNSVNHIKHLYTVDYSEYRLATINDPVDIYDPQIDYMITVVRLQELTFASPYVGGGDKQYHIVPTVTSYHEIWRGYQVHWCADLTNISYKPSTSQKNNLLNTLDSENHPTYVPINTDVAMNTFLPQISILTLGNTYQEFTVDTLTDVTNITLHSKFHYNPIVPQVFATSSSEIRVYINNVHQSGNYIEHYASALPIYTAINDISGHMSNSTIVSVSYISQIEFVVGVVKKGDIVRIDIGSASFIDMGLTCVPVRTIQDNTSFLQAVDLGTQPIYTSLVKYRKTEQIKDRINQYPLFNVYDILTNDVNTVSPIFAYQEDPTQPIDRNTNRRITITNSGTEFSFVQYLIDADNSKMYAYRNTQKLLTNTYWYNPTTDIIQCWNGDSWSQYIDVNVHNSLTIRKLQVSPIDVPSVWTMDQAMWFNSTTRVLYRRHTSSNSWTSVPNVIINETDPSLQTIWRHGIYNDQYVPAYVDKDHKPVLVGSALGDWEVVNQWRYNPEHSNKKHVTYSQLFSHFNTIIENQQGIPGLSNNGVYAYLQDEYQYNVGGTIKEYNYGFDNLISAINVDNITPVGVIEFAQEEYNVNLFNIRAIFNSLIYSTFINVTVDSILDFKSVISNSIITNYESNETTAKIYGDTTAYNHNTKLGIKNWISTAPMFGLSPSHMPSLSIDGENSYIVHHDGHRTQLTYTNAEIDNLSRKLVAQIDSRSNQPIGRISTSNVPSTVTSFLSNFTGYGATVMTTGVYWYIPGNTPRLYRFEMFQSSMTAPSIYHNGVLLPINTMYYNTVDKAVYKISANGWILATIIGSQTIEPMWIQLNLAELLGNAYLNIENELYAISQSATPKFDYQTITSDQVTYNTYRHNRFDYFVNNGNIIAPLINTQYSNSSAWTWNYSASIVTVPPYNTSSGLSYACWQAVYTNWYNTPFPHLEPWKLQGYINKPHWWDSTYGSTTGLRRWTQLMWTNILNGVIPIGHTYPSGIISTGNAINDNQVVRLYNYVSVNTSDVIIDGYLPDALFPPYYSTVDTVNRSIFNEYGQIIAPDADYAFGDQGPIEWQWMTSIQYQYDNMVIAFLMQPVKFLHYAFGQTSTIVDQLQVDNKSGVVYNHKDVLFHGDIYDTNKVYKVNGLNQWYVNYNRYTNFDTNTRFRDLWTKWTPTLTYQMAGIIDTNSIGVTNVHFDIIASDYTQLLVNSGIINDVWLDAFNVTLVSIPPSIAQYNNQSLWMFNVNTLAKVPRTIQYYGVKSYPFVVDTTTNVCSVYTYDIISVDVTANRLYVVGDQSNIFVANSTIDITYSGTTVTNTVLSSVYESSLNQTRVNVTSTLNVNMISGTVRDSLFNIPWTSGDMVVLSSSKLLPYPLVAETPYYIVRNNTMAVNQFKLSETIADSVGGITIDFTTVGSGEILVSEISSSFQVLGSQSTSREMWFHYQLDTNVIKTTTFPTTIKGMQNLVNVIDGIVETYIQSGFILNSADSNDFDPMTGRLITWQLEIERFIDWAFGIRSLKINTNDRYPITVNASTNTVSFSGMIPQWTNGAKIMVTSSGNIPSPMYAYSPYYLHQSTTTDHIISISADPMDTSAYVDFIDVGSGVVSLSAFSIQSNFPSFEINPSRNNILLATPQGVVANVISGPSTDARVRTTTFDQYGRSLTSDNVNLYREDLRTRINILPNIQNDVDRYYTNDPYNYIHLGGGHLFVEGYEHFILFNNYTVGNELLYDPFLGITVSKINLDYYEKRGYLLRPTLGGYYLVGNEFKRNIEGQATDLSNIYDAFLTVEDSNISNRARNLLGYAGSLPYLDMLKIKSKSQFMFYRGMIASKGSINSLQAYVNNKQFLAAHVDEYWAYQVSTYGDIRPKVWPEVNVLSTDNIVDDIRFEFVGQGESVYSLGVQKAQQSGFTVCSYLDESRWNNYPQQMNVIKDSLFLDAEVTSESIVIINPFPPPISLSNNYTHWYNTTNHTLHLWNSVDWSTIVIDKVKVDTVSKFTYWKHDAICDDVRVVRDEISTALINYNIVGLSQTNKTFTIPQNQTLSVYGGMTGTVIASTGNNTTTPYNIVKSSYDDLLSVTIVTVDQPIPSGLVDGQFVVNVTNFTDYNSNILTNRATGFASYYPLNSEVVRFSNTAFSRVLRIYTVNPSKNKTNPVELVDIKSDNVVRTLSLWHPALGYHYTIADHNIDLKNSSDPALYGHTVNPNEISDKAWNYNEVDTVWLDTSYLAYLPYYDVAINPDIDVRLANWGKLCDFGKANVYVWTSSAVTPYKWGDLVISQANNTTIAQNDKTTGTVKQELFTNDRTIFSGTLNYTTSQLIITSGTVQYNDKIVFSTSSYVPADIVISDSYYVTTVGTNLSTFQIVDIHNNLITFTQPTEVVEIIGVSLGTNLVGTVYTDVVSYQIQAPINLVLNGDIVKFTTTGLLPDGISANTDYIVVNVEVDVYGTHAIFSLTGLNGGAIVIAPPKGTNGDYNEVGKGTLTIEVVQRAISLTTGFKDNNWTRRPFIRKHDPAPMIITQHIFPVINPIFAWIKTDIDPVWYNGESVDIYVNGHLAHSNGIVVTTDGINISVATTTDGSLSINNIDIIDIVRSFANVDLTFDPLTLDDGTKTTAWKQDYEYTTVAIEDSRGNTNIRYYFWVSNSTNLPIRNNPMSVYGVADSMTNNPDPHFILQKPLDIPSAISANYGYDVPPYGDLWSGGTNTITSYNQFPIAYREAIIREVASYVSTNSKYMIRFTRDLTLRDDIQAGGYNNLKDVHQDWALFRKEQQFNVPLYLWHKLMESLSGISIPDINGQSIAVPSLDRVLYDQVYLTDTRFGLDVGQTFVDKTLGLATLMNYLTKSNIDFSPIDIGDFFEHYSFDTPANIQTALMIVYNTFGHTHVNTIWFNILQDALTNKNKYKGLLKTSWVSIHGVQYMNVGGIFDE